MSDKPSESQVEYSKEEELGDVHNAANDFKAHAHINNKLRLLIMFGMFGGTAYGFSAAVIASSLGQPNLAVYFNFATESNITLKIGAMVASYNIGGMFGPILVCLIQDRWGRKSGYIFSSILVLIGGALQAGAADIAMWCVGRLLAGMGGFSFMLCSIVYLSEISPSHNRGLCAGLFAPGINSGYVVAAFVGLGFFYVSNHDNWRIVLTFMLIPPLIILAMLPFVPESPRWLSMKGRNEEALEVLKSLHGHPSDPSFLLAREEAFQIKAQIELDSRYSSNWGAMFTKYGKRTAIAVLIFVGNQGTGVQIPVNYGPTIYAGLGFSTPISLTIAATQLVWSVVCTTLAATVMDRVGRRKMLMISTLGCAGVIGVLGGLVAHYDPTKSNARSIGDAVIFTFYLHVVSYTIGESSLYTYIGEIFPAHVRVKGIAVGIFTLNAMTVWITFCQPPATAAIGWKYYMVFVALSITTTIIQYFVLPETARVPLEEINRVFGDADDVAVNATDIVVKGDIITTAH